jgi:hypothetical protein
MVEGSFGETLGQSFSTLPSGTQPLIWFMDSRHENWFRKEAGQSIMILEDIVALVIIIILV